MKPIALPASSNGCDSTVCLIAVLQLGDDRLGRALGGGDAAPHVEGNRVTLLCRGRDIREDRIALRAPSTASTRRSPLLTCDTSAAGSCTTPSMRLPSRFTTAWPSPNGTSMILAPPVTNRADAEKWVWLPLPELPMRTLPGLALACSISSVQRLPWRVGAHRDDGRLDAHTRHRVERAIVERQGAGMVRGRDRVRVPDDRVAVGRCFLTWL